MTIGICKNTEHKKQINEVKLLCLVPEYAHWPS